MADTKEVVTNAMFVKEDKSFKSACEKAGTEPTVRQASKFRNKKGIAYKSTRRK